MLRQYNPQRFRTRNGRHVGTVDVGTVVYIQDNVRPFSRLEYPVLRDPWIVEAWFNREYHPAVKGKPHTTYMLGGHLAQVRSLRTGRVRLVADWIILRCVDAGLDREYPQATPKPLTMTATA